MSILSNVPPQILVLDVNQNDSYTTIEMKQGDKKSRKISLQLVAGGEKIVVDESVNCAIYASLNGVAKENKTLDDTCIQEDGSILFEVTDRMLEESGMLECELSLFSTDSADKEEVLTSASFQIKVGKNHKGKVISFVNQFKNWVTTEMIQKEAVTGTKLAKNCVASSHINTDAITSDKIRKRAVTPEKLDREYVEKGYDLTVMSFNIGGFSNVNSDINLMNSIFNKYKPDIVGFQEYYTGAKVGGIPTDEYVKSICPDLFVGPPISSIVCNSVISNYKLFNASSTWYTTQAGNRRYFQKMYIYVDDVKIAVFNTHLNTSANYASKKAQTLEIIEACSHEKNFILMGDFNINVKSSEDAAYVDFIKPFNDAGFNLANCSERFGFMDTWTGGTTADDSSWVPCDNIITSPNIRIESVFVDKQKIDANTGTTIDHLPIIAHLKINIPKGELSTSPYIGESGNWYIGDADTGVKADFSDDIDIPIIYHTETTALIEPKVFNIWGEVTELNISLAAPTADTVYNEYMLQFSSGATATVLTLPDTVKWVCAPIIEPNKIYQISIVNNIGVLVGA